jgi:hypothetical protein
MSYPRRFFPAVAGKWAFFDQLLQLCSFQFLKVGLQVAPTETPAKEAHMDMTVRTRLLARILSA